MAGNEWIVHPNRSALGPDEPGRNGHLRSVTSGPVTRRPLACSATLELPRKLAYLADADGSITFGGPNWWLVVGPARIFARQKLRTEVPPPFGYFTRGQWWWWDDTTTDESILDGDDAISYVREYLQVLFPKIPITLSVNP